MCALGLALLLPALVAAAPPFDLEDQAETMGHMLNAVRPLRRRPVVNTAVFDAIAAAPDPIYTAPLIDLLSFVGGRNPIGEAIVGALEAVTGDDIGRDWRSYRAVVGRGEIPLPRGYASFKSRLFAEMADEEFSRFFPRGVAATSRVNLAEVVWGGVAVDGIPSLVNASQVTPQAAARQGRRLTRFCRETEDGPDCRYPAPDELVFGVAIEGEARAYPLRILNWHELANDEFPGGRHVALVYCTLCGSGILYDTSVGSLTYTDPETTATVTLEAEALEFGSTGLLMRSNKLMYDRQTDTVWNAMTGTPAFGPLAEVEGLALRKLPLVVTDWRSWYAEHPDTTVLSLDTGYERDYTDGAAYRSYFDDPDALMFPVPRRDPSARDGAPEPRAMIFGLEVSGDRKAYPLEILAAERVTNDRLGGRGVVIVTRPTPEREFFEPGGAAVRAYERGDFSFSPTADPGFMVDRDGRRWRITEDALLGPGGTRLNRLPGHLAFWFGWQAFYPETELHEGAAD